MTDDHLPVLTGHARVKGDDAKHKKQAKNIGRGLCI